MFAWIDALPWWIDMVIAVAFILGCLAGRRWAYVKMKAECDARACPEMKAVRTDLMKCRADSLTAKEVNEWQRKMLMENGAKIHALKTSNGKMARELERLTHQMARPVRRLA